MKFLDLDDKNLDIFHIKSNKIEKNRILKISLIILLIVLVISLILYIKICRERIFIREELKNSVDIKN